MFDWIWTNNSLVGTIYRVEGRLKGAESHCHGSRRTGAVDIHSAGSTGNFLTVPPSLDKTIFWLGADRLDTKQADYEIGCEPHIYKIDAVGYESLMMGLIQLRYGLPNEVCAPCQGKPKLTELQLACSRDGFHGEPKLPRDLFRLPNDRGSGNAHTSIMLGVCVITRDQLLLRSISGQRVRPKSVAPAGVGVRQRSNRSGSSTVRWFRFYEHRERRRNSPHQVSDVQWGAYIRHVDAARSRLQCEVSTRR